MPQGHAGVVAGQDRLDQPERGEGDHLADGQRRRGEHDRLGGQHRAAARRPLNVTRISPVLYSAVNASTPSTLTAITAYSRLMTSGSSGSGGGP